MPESLDVSYQDPPVLEVAGAGPEPIVVEVAPTETLALTDAGAPFSVQTVAPEPYVVTLAAPEAVTFSLVEPEPIVIELGGLRGPAGPPGGAGGTGSPVYRHHQAAPALTWTIDHGLGYYPNVAVQDSAGSVVTGDVTYVDANSLTITFSVAFGGYANLS